MQIKNIARAAGAAAVLFAAGAAGAAQVTLTFEGLANQALIGNYYGGGAGTDYGVIFSSDAMAIIDSDAGGSGDFANEPSPSTVMALFPANSAVMNLAAEYIGAFSFQYSTVDQIGVVQVFDGLDGTGNPLDTISLSALGRGCVSTADPGQFNCWEQKSIVIGGAGARSFRFEGGQLGGQVIFDNITFGIADPGTVPTPGTLALSGVALLALAATLRRRAA